MADLALLRRDLRAFAEEIGCPLTPWQARAVQSSKRTVVIVAPRQSGKSRTLAALALWRAFRRPGTRVLIVSASEDAARRLLAEVRRLAGDSPLLASSVTLELAGLVTLSNGSEIRSTPASERAIRGWSADVLIVDEAALVSDDLILGSAIPTTAARPDAQIFMASSATVASGAFYDYVQRGLAGSEHTETVHWALDDCEWLLPSVIQAMRDSMSPTRFAAEMEGRFASGEDSLFSRAGLERVTREYRAWALGALRGPARVLGGCDWGATTDRSAVSVFGRVPGEARLRLLVAHRYPAGEPLANVIEDVARCPAHWDALTLERNGLGEPCAQAVAREIRRRPRAEGGRGNADDRPAALLGPWATAQNTGPHYRPPPRRLGARPQFGTRINPVHTSAPMKAAAYSALRLLVDREQIEFPAAAPELLRELLLLRVDLSASGDERIAAAGTGHDDIADAAMLALAPYRGRDGRWITVAERALVAGVPPAQFDATDDPDAFQSVRGPEITTAIPMSHTPVPVEVGAGLVINPGGFR